MEPLVGPHPLRSALQRIVAVAGAARADLGRPDHVGSVVDDADSWLAYLGPCTAGIQDVAAF